MVVGPGGIPGTTDQFETLLPYVVLAMLAGPSVAGVLSTGLVHGRAGFREFLSRLLKWRVGARWYAIALLTAPLLVTVTLFALSLTSPVFLPGIVTTSQPAPYLLFGIAVGLAAGLFEELGWTGFAVPAMRLRCGVFATGFIVGLLWGAWHFLASWWGSSGSSGALSMAVYLPVMLFSFLPPYRVLMVWVYDRTGSLLVAMLMHASLTGSMLVFGPLAISGVALLTYNVVLGAALWVAVAVIAVADRGQLGRLGFSK
jgi:CAAX protease family protein